MEFITVRYLEHRTVYIDGEPAGFTNRTLRVNRGTHTINLGDPRDYEPKWRRSTIEGTASPRPMEVTFEKI
jgi:hypothetical protein